MLFVGGFMSYLRCLQECSCLVYLVCRRAHILFTLFVGGLMSYLRCFQEDSCLIYVVCRRTHVLFTLFVGGLMSYLRCLQEGSCLIYVVCRRGLLTIWYINHNKIKGRECIHVTCTVFNYLTTIVQSTGSSSLS